MPLPQETGNFSYADYLTWPENERWEIIDGIAYRQAAPSLAHQEVSGNLFVQFHNYLAGKPCKVYFAPFSVRLTESDEKKNEDIKKVVEPDITIVCDSYKIDREGCKGVPDLIVEVLSPSTIKMDRLIKFNKYEMAGVREYWIVEPENKIVSVFVLGNDQKYGRPEIYAEDDQIKVGIFPELAVDLRLVFTGGEG